MRGSGVFFFLAGRMIGGPVVSGAGVGETVGERETHGQTVPAIVVGVVVPKTEER